MTQDVLEQQTQARMDYEAERQRRRVARLKFSRERSALRRYLDGGGALVPDSVPGIGDVMKSRVGAARVFVVRLEAYEDFERWRAEQPLKAPPKPKAKRKARRHD